MAEGVETEAELSTLGLLGAGSVQGYFLARPMQLGEALSQPFPKIELPGRTEVAGDSRASRSLIESS